MKMDLLQEIKEAIRRSQYNEKMNNSQKEAYENVSFHFAKLLATIEEQHSILRRMSYHASETGNSNLSDLLQMLSRHVMSEYEVTDDCRKICRNIASN